MRISSIIYVTLGFYFHQIVYIIEQISRNIQLLQECQLIMPFSNCIKGAGIIGAHDQFPLRVLLQGAKTPEEMMLIKQNTVAAKNPFHRDWEYGEFEANDMAPLYDLSRRRLKYPEHYEGRYKDVKKTVWGEVLEVTPKVVKKQQTGN